MATIPQFDSFAAGEIVTAAKLNKNVRDAGNFLKNPPTLRLEATVTRAIATSTWVANVFDNEIEDSDGMWTSGSTITVKTPGIWIVTSIGAFASNTVGTRLLRFNINGVAVNGRASQGATPNYETSLPLTRLVRFATNDTFKVELWQNTGASLNTTVGADAKSTLEMVWVSE